MNIGGQQFLICAFIALVIFMVFKNAKAKRDSTYVKHDPEDEILVKFLLSKVGERGMDKKTISKLESMDSARLQRYLVREHILTNDEVQNYRAMIEKHIHSIRKVLN